MEDVLASLGPSELTVEQIDALTQKLEGLLPQQTTEDGLPIVDITEPVESDLSSLGATLSMEEPDLIPLAHMSPAEKDLRRKERDRILAELELEEMLQDTETRISEDQTMQARRDLAKQELERIMKERELSRKMGKALLRNMADARELKEKEMLASSSTLAPSTSKEPTLGSKKSVTFDIPPTPTDSTGAPMKFKVVERVPMRPVEAPRLNLGPPDSDDETDEEEVHTKPPHRASLESNPDPDSDSDTVNEDLEMEEETDFDAANHQREIAMAYYKQRSRINARARDAVANLAEEDEWDRPVSMDASRSDVAQYNDRKCRWKLHWLTGVQNQPAPSITRHYRHQLFKMRFEPES